MNERPFRMQRPAEARGSQQPRQTPRQPEPQQEPVNETPKPTPQPTDSPQRPKTKTPTKWTLLPFILIIILLLGVIGWLIWQGAQTASGIVDDSKYQAVSTVDGQVYFGKVVSVNSDYVKLTDAYYLQTQIAPQTETADGITQDNVEVVKLNNKVYSPEDEIIIPKHQVLSYENLQPGSQVADFIQENRDSADSLGN